MASAVPASAPAAGRKRGADSGFLKTFPSDMDDAQVHKLLLEIKTADPLYKGRRHRHMIELTQELAE